MRVRLLLAAVATLIAVSLPAAPASAHTAMLRASPDRDATVGGSVRHVDLLFLERVTDASVTVTYNGVPVAGSTTVADGEVITFVLEQPLVDPGRYQVTYEMISFDSDFTTGGFFFTFDPVADQAARIEPPGSGESLTTTLVLSGIGLTVLVVLLGLFVWWLDNRRRQQYVDAAYGEEAWDDW